MIEAEIGGHRLQPSPGGRALADGVEPLERLEEHRLRDVLGLGFTAQEADGGGEHHVLVTTDECLEPVGVGHAKRGRLLNAEDEPGEAPDGFETADERTLPASRITVSGARGAPKRYGPRRRHTWKNTAAGGKFQLSWKSSTAVSLAKLRLKPPSRLRFARAVSSCRAPRGEKT